MLRFPEYFLLSLVTISNDATGLHAHWDPSLPGAGIGIGSIWRFGASNSIIASPAMGPMGTGIIGGIGHGAAGAIMTGPPSAPGSASASGGASGGASVSGHQTGVGCQAMGKTSCSNSGSGREVVTSVGVT